jgi:hypothetical protein
MFFVHIFHPQISDLDSHCCGFFLDVSSRCFLLAVSCSTDQLEQKRAPKEYEKSTSSKKYICRLQQHNSKKGSLTGPDPPSADVFGCSAALSLPGS